MSVKVPSVKDLFDAGVHLGHPVRRWNPKFAEYIYKVCGNSHIINLEKTHEQLKKACEFLEKVGKESGQVILVGTKKQVTETLKREAETVGALYVTERWLGGTITNYPVLKTGIAKLVDMRKKRDSGEYGVYTKKERLLIDREIEKSEASVGGLVGMRERLGALVVIDPHRERTAVREAKKRGIPVVALIDTDSDPTEIDYPIPGNDDAIKSIVLVVKSLMGALESGYNSAKKDAEKAEEAEKAEKVVEEAVEEEKKIEKVAKPEKAEKAEKAKPKKEKKAEKADKVEKKEKKELPKE